MVGMVSRRCFLPVPSASLGSSQLGQGVMASCVPA